MKRIAIAMSCVAMCAAGPAAARADTIMHMDSVQFISDLQPSMSIDLPSFDNQGGLLTLLSVLVEVSHSASVDLSADNDDPFNAAEVRGRLIRIWSAGGPGVATGANFAAFTPFVPLAADDGDGGNVLNFDPSPPDGVAFGTFGYPLTLVSSHNPAVGLYSTNGPGTVSFLVTPQLMSQDLQWQGSPPDAWQMEVQNPLLDVKVAVTYEYIPEPATLSLVALGAVSLFRRRKLVTRAA